MNRYIRGVIALFFTGSVMASITACSGGSTSSDSFSFVSPGGQTEIYYSPEQRQAIKNFSGQDLMNPEHTINLSDYDGQMVVLNAWGQWCAPCRVEADDLESVQEKLVATGKGTVLGINVRDSVREKAQDFVTDNNLTYPSVYDPPFKSAASLGGFPASVIPTTIVLDSQHRPAYIFLQGITEDELWDAIQAVLDEDS